MKIIISILLFLTVSCAKEIVPKSEVSKDPCKGGWVKLGHYLVYDDCPCCPPASRMRLNSTGMLISEPEPLWDTSKTAKIGWLGVEEFNNEATLPYRPAKKLAQRNSCGIPGCRVYHIPEEDRVTIVYHFNTDTLKKE